MKVRRITLKGELEDKREIKGPTKKGWLNQKKNKTRTFT